MNFRLRAFGLHLLSSAAVLTPDEPVILVMAGRGSPLVAVFDRDTLRVRALLRSER